MALTNKHLTELEFKAFILKFMLYRRGIIQGVSFRYKNEQIEEINYYHNKWKMVLAFRLKKIERQVGGFSIRLSRF